MTVEDLMSEVRHLSVEERLQLLELLSHSLHEDWRPEKTPRPPAGPERPERGEPSLFRVESQYRLRGLLKSNEPPPTSAELAAAYADHLLEKYK